MCRAVGLVLAMMAGAACTTPNPRVSTLKVSYYTADAAFANADPLRVSVGTGTRTHSLRGIELSSSHPFLVSAPLPIDSGVTLPITVMLVGMGDDTLAHAQMMLDPVEPAMSYTLGIVVGGRTASTASSRCGTQVAVPLQRVRGEPASDSLYVRLTGMREDSTC